MSLLLTILKNSLMAYSLTYKYLETRLRSWILFSIECFSFSKDTHLPIPLAIDPILEKNVHFVLSILLNLSAGALALPTSGEHPSLLEKRIGHTGWIASCAPNDYQCADDYYGSPADHPTLNWAKFGAAVPVKFLVT